MTWWHLTAASSTNHIHRFLILATNLRHRQSILQLGKSPREGLVQCHSEVCAQAGPRTQISQLESRECPKISDSQLVVPEQLQQQHLGTC